MLEAPQRDEFSRSVRRRAETAQPPRPGAAKLRGRQNNSDLRLNVSGKPAETTARHPVPMISDGAYPQYTKASTLPLPGGRAALSLRLKLRADPRSAPETNIGVIRVIRCCLCVIARSEATWQSPRPQPRRCQPRNTRTMRMFTPTETRYEQRDTKRRFRLNSPSLSCRFI
jgi:hypothetical protein